jgi:uncharacterized membrane protein YraQ (UPF0718 family)
LPAALGLRRQGASKGATASFLISVPETDVVSVLLTYGLLGPVMAVARPLAALVTAFVTGVAVDRIDAIASQSPTEVEDSDLVDEADCGCEPGEDAIAANRRPWFWRALHFGFVEFFDDITGPLIVGLALAGVVGALAPSIEGFRFADQPALGYLLALGIGIPTYVCATATTPLAVGLIAAGMTPGAALVLLLVGPATNVASFVVLGREFGRRIVAVYVAGIVLVSVVFGLLVDALWGGQIVLASGEHVAAEHSAWWQIGAAILFAALLIMSVIRTRQVPKLAARIARPFRAVFAGR